MYIGIIIMVDATVLEAMSRSCILICDAIGSRRVRWKKCDGGQSIQWLRALVHLVEGADNEPNKAPISRQRNFACFRD